MVILDQLTVARDCIRNVDCGTGSLIDLKHLCPFNWRKLTLNPQVGSRANSFSGFICTCTINARTQTTLRASAYSPATRD